MRSEDRKYRRYMKEINREIIEPKSLNQALSWKDFDGLPVFVLH